MVRRLKLHEEFCEILESKSVYFQPPDSTKMEYPCIRYSKYPGYKRNANDKIYLKKDRYDGVVIDRDPDSEIPDKLLERFPMCSFGSCYRADNLNHFPFTIYY